MFGEWLSFIFYLFDNLGVEHDRCSSLKNNNIFNNNIIGVIILTGVKMIRV